MEPTKCPPLPLQLGPAGDAKHCSCREQCDFGAWPWVGGLKPCRCCHSCAWLAKACLQLGHSAALRIESKLLSVRVCRLHQCIDEEMVMLDSDPILASIILRYGSGRRTPPGSDLGSGRSQHGIDVKPWLIDFQTIHMRRMIGSGSFGRVSGSHSVVCC